MTTRILVPLDGSDKDERALTVAVAMAELTGGSLHLIRVLETPIADLSPRARTMGVLDAARELRAEIQRDLREWSDRVATWTGRPATVEYAEESDVPRRLVDRSGSPDIECIVMATRAAGALTRSIRGSVADRVMRESVRPVLFVPPGADGLSAYKVVLRRVLVPLDGSSLAALAADHLLQLDRARILEYTLLRVHTAPGDTADVLQPIADRLRANGAARVQTRTVEGSDVPGAIQQIARDEKADFIAMSTRGKSGVERFVFGSVAEGVVRRSDLPVLLIRRDDA